jgi:AcrR family transcriptional regulator
MRPEKRAALIAAAAREFASRTYEEASLNHIIGSCGLSKSSFYHVVDSKEGLFSLVVSELSAAADRTWTAPEPASFADRFWDRADSVWQEALTTWPNSPELTQLWHIVYTNPDNEAVLKLADRVRTWVRDVLITGRETGAVDRTCPLDLQSLAVFSLLRTFDEWALTAAGDDSPDEAAAHQFRLLKRLLHP